MRKQSVRAIAMQAIVAALYVVLTWAVAPLSFGAVQFRFSEIMILIVFVDKRYGPAMILACALANCFSPLGIVDVIFGTAATFCAVECIKRSKSLLIATLWPTLFCVIIGVELNVVSDLPFLFTTFTIMLGEFVVVTCIGYPIFKALMKNEALLKLIKLD